MRREVLGWPGEFLSFDETNFFASRIRLEVFDGETFSGIVATMRTEFDLLCDVKSCDSVGECRWEYMGAHWFESNPAARL